MVSLSTVSPKVYTRVSNKEKRNRLLFVNYLRVYKDLGPENKFVSKNRIYEIAGVIFNIEGATAGRIIRKYLKLTQEEQIRILSSIEANEMIDTLKEYHYAKEYR